MLGEPDLEISDEVLRLRYWRAADEQVLVNEMQDQVIIRWILHIPVPYGAANAREFIELVNSERSSGCAAHLAIEDVLTDRVVGGVALTHIDSLESTADVGYWVASAFRRRGVATRATGLLATWAFDTLKLQRLTLYADPENEFSHKVAERCGFTREGLLRGHTFQRAGGRRDSVIFGRLASDSPPEN